MLLRKGLNDFGLHRGGVLFDQAVDVNDPAKPKLHWQGTQPRQ
jgi:hypothetical protein